MGILAVGTTSTGRVLSVAAMALMVAWPATAAAPKPRDPSLVAHYTFEEGPDSKVVKDWSGHRNNGKNMGAEYVKGPEGAGYVLRFEDAQAMVECGNRPSLNLTKALSIELWYYAENQRVSGGEPGLVGKSLQSYVLSSAGCWFYVKRGDVRFDCAVSAGESCPCPPSRPWPRPWTKAPR